MLDREQIMELIPHRPPFLWIDRIIEIEPRKRCVGSKYIDPESDFFKGHFPGNAILPGVFIIEAAAQVAGVMAAYPDNSKAREKTKSSSEESWYLAAINRFKFLKPVLPGCEIKIETRHISGYNSMAFIEAIIEVDGEIVAKGGFSVVTS